MSEASESCCPKCGVSLPADATGGLCPRCLMAEAMEPTRKTLGSASDRTPLSPTELAPHFPQLEILECLGRGGMGVVYKARQKSLNRIVALKLLAPERIGDSEFAERFAQEARALAALNHSNIVTIHDFGQAGGFYFLLMEFVDGVNLREAMSAGRFAPEQALAVVPPVCEAMQCAHDAGIVHRDIKPENLLLDKDGQIKIADFGISKMLDTESSNIGMAESQPAGTPRYMAPEQKDLVRTDHRADIYSLGVVLYELLTGELPGDKLQPPSRKVKIDVRLDEIVLRALETAPELRYQSAAELRTQVETMVMTLPSKSAPSNKRPRLIKSGFSILTNPEKLATMSGQLFCISSRGQLVLDDQQITHSRGGVDTVIPLTAIRDLSIGPAPRAINPAGLDLISVTYSEGGESKQILLSPQQGFFASPGNFNAGVNEWFRRIQDAATEASGQPPRRSTPAELDLPRSNPGMLLLGLGAVLVVLSPVWIVLMGGMVLRQIREIDAWPLVIGLTGFVAVVGLIGWLGRRRRINEPNSRKDGPGGLTLFAGMAMISVLLLGAVFILTRSNIPLRLQPQGEVIAKYSPVEIRDNILLVDFMADVTGGPCEMQTYLIGPQPSEHELIGSFDLIDAAKVDVIWSRPIQMGAAVRIATNGVNRWQAAFVFPDRSLAKRAWDRLQPIGPLDVRHDRGSAGELFRVSGPGGKKYQAFFAAAPMGQHLRGQSRFPMGEHIGRNDHSVLVKHDHMKLHYALYHAGDFSSSTSGTRNERTGSWVDDGVIQIPNKRRFGYTRLDRYPDELKVNGTDYDLRKGRVLILKDDGTVEQVSLEVPLPVARNPIALGEMIQRYDTDVQP